MYDDSLKSIQMEIREHKNNCALQDYLEAQCRIEGETMSPMLLQRLSQLRRLNTMVRSWLSVLNEDEAYVIRRHLIDGVTWPRLEAEHRTIWKEFGKSKRTLMRYEKNALKRIQQIIREGERSL